MLGEFGGGLFRFQYKLSSIPSETGSKFMQTPGQKISNQRACFSVPRPHLSPQGSLQPFVGIIRGLDAAL